MRKVISTSNKTVLNLRGTGRTRTQQVVYIESAGKNKKGKSISTSYTRHEAV